MDALTKWMIIRFTPFQTITPNPKMDVLPKFFCSNHPCCLKVSAAFKYVPQTTVTTFAFSSVFTFFYEVKEPRKWFPDNHQPKPNPFNLNSFIPYTCCRNLNTSPRVIFLGLRSPGYEPGTDACMF